MSPIPSHCCALLCRPLLAGLAALLVLCGCRTPPPARPSEPVHAGDDYLARAQERTFREFLVGPANLRETGEPPSFQEVTDKSVRKFVRGVANVTTGWVEIPKQVYNTWYLERGLVSPVIGLGKGVGMAVSRELVGVFEMALPFAPIPGDWNPIIEPEFVFESELPRSALKPQRKKKVPWWRRARAEPAGGSVEGGDTVPATIGPPALPPASEIPPAADPSRDRRTPPSPSPPPPSPPPPPGG